MTTGFTPEEQHFLQLLDRNPEFRDAVRRRLLSDELLDMPARFSNFIETVEAFILEQRRTNIQSDSRMQSIERGQETITRRIDGLSGQISDAKGDRAIQATIRKGPQICRELQLSFSRRLDQADIIKLTPREAAQSIEPSELESFENADLVMEATDDDGHIRMVVVEASYRANRRDTGRAVRNADYLNQFTGLTTHAVIASVENDAEAQKEVTDETVRWHRLQERDLQPR